MRDAFGNVSPSPSTGQWILRILMATVCVALASGAVIHYKLDENKRQAANQFVDSFHVRERRPAYADAIENSLSADLAYEVVANVALQDSSGPVQLSELDTDTRALWKADMGRTDEELSAARTLLIQALSQRPSWPYHQSLLGMIEYTRGAKQRRFDAQSRNWLRLLVSGMHGAPGDPALPTFAGLALTKSWGFLDQISRREAPTIFRAALSDPEFVADNYPSLVDSVGSVRAESFLPISAPALRAAMNIVSKAGDARAATRLQIRWEKAEWRAREADLREIEERARFDDGAGVEKACEIWTQKHSEYDFDHAAGQQQVARVLELWPDKPASWRVDRRAELIQYFMNGRMKAINPEILARPIEALSDVPAPIAARAALAMGDIFRAESIAGSAEASSSFEWTQFHVDSAWHHLRAGDAAAAVTAVARIAPSARDECEVALVRRAVAQALSVREDVSAGLLPQHYPPDFWSHSGVPICIDPSAGYKRLAIMLDVGQSPSLVAFGFDGGRSSATLLKPGTTRISLPLGARSGRHFLSYQLIAGGAISPALASLEK